MQRDDTFPPVLPEPPKKITRTREKKSQCADIILSKLDINDTVTTLRAAEWLVEGGFSAASASSTLTTLVHNGILARASRTTWTRVK